MYNHQQTIADIEREQAPSFWSIVSGAALFLSSVLVMAWILAI